MLLGRVLIYFIFLYSTLLYCKEVTIDSTFYPPKIDRYCIRPTDDTDIEIGVDSRRKNCITAYNFTEKLGEDCAYSSYLHLYNLHKGTTYYVIEAKLKSSTKKTDYSITAKGDNFEFGLCPTETLAKPTNTDSKQIAFTLTIAGVATGLLFFGSITYIFLRI